MAKRALSRRTMLRGAAGGLVAALGLPPLEAMFTDDGRAYADGTAPARRFALWWWAQGVTASEWFPRAGSRSAWWQGGRQVGTVDDTWTAGSELQPFVDAGLRSDISIITGSRLFSFDEEMHQSQMIGMLTGWPMRADRTPSYDTLPVVLSKRWGAPTASGFPILGASVAAQYTLGLPNERSPQAMFDRVFGVSTTLPGKPRFSAASKASVLDLVGAEAKALSAKLGTADQRRLDAHFQSVRALEQRVRALPDAGTSGLTLTRPTVVRTDPDGPMPDLAGYADAFSDVMAMALAMNRTRVLSVLLESGQSPAVFEQVGIRIGMHALTHPPAGDAAAEAAARAELHDVTIWKMKRLAHFVSALKAIPEGAGTLLDNTLVMAGTEMDDPFSHYCINNPMLFAGGAGGRFKTGRHYSAFVPDPTRADGGPYTWGPGASNQECTSKALLTVLQALGEPDTTYGGTSSDIPDPAGTSSGWVDAPFSALLT